MNAQSANKRGFRVALVSFMVAGFLAILLLASLGTSWGVAYGQTAGPSQVCATNPAGTPIGQLPGQNNPSCEASAVKDASTRPTTAASVVENANQGPVGVVPGLPNTGTSSQAADNNSWQLIVLALLVANMLIAGLVMRKYSKSSKSR